jgi:hypothetical protein
MPSWSQIMSLAIERLSIFSLLVSMPLLMTAVVQLYWGTQPGPYPASFESSEISGQCAGQNQCDLIQDGVLAPDHPQDGGPLRPINTRPGSGEIGDDMNPHMSGVEQLTIYDGAEQLSLSLDCTCYIRN